MVDSRVGFVAVLLAFCLVQLLSMKGALHLEQADDYSQHMQTRSTATQAPAHAAAGTSIRSEAEAQLRKAGAWGGRKVLSGGPSRIIVNGVVVFESRPDKPTKSADVARPNESPPPASLSFRGVAEDNSPPPSALTRPAAPSLAIPPLPPRLAERDDDLRHGSSPPSSVSAFSPPMFDDHGGDTRDSGAPADKDDKSGSPSGKDDNDNSGSPSGKDDKGSDDSSGKGKDKDEDKDKSKGKGKGSGKD